MLRKILNTILSASIALGPVSASAADRFYFRLTTPSKVIYTPPVDEDDDTEYEAGDDIVAYYSSPVGYDFSKKIPVSTPMVAEWRVASGSVPAGIGFDITSGLLSGKPAVEGSDIVLFHGYDASGTRIARAEVHFNVFEPVGATSSIDYYAHAGTYFFAEIPTPEGVTVQTWTPVGDLPAGMSMVNSAFQGTPTKAGDYLMAWKGFDYLGREVAFAYGDFTVQDGPVVEEAMADGSYRSQIGDQIADKTRSESFKITPAVRRSLGTVTYRLVPETVRPSGLTFSSATGVLGGVFSEFETSASFRIQARDSYDGTVGYSNVFTLKTLPSDSDMAAVAHQSGTVGSSFYRKLSAANVVAGAKWQVVQGSLPEGLTLGESTGIISGTPTKTETQSGIVVRVSGNGMIAAESNPFTFQVFSEEIAGSTTAVTVRVGGAFSTEGVAVTKGGGEGFTITAESLPPGVSLNEATGVLSAPTGIATAGIYDLALTVQTPGRSKKVWQSLRVYNSLAVAYDNIEVSRYSSFSADPTVPPDSTVGAATFSIRDVNGAPIPEWLKLNKDSGRISLNPTHASTAGATFGPYLVTVKDSRDAAVSAPFSIKVNQRPNIEVWVNNRNVQQFVPNFYMLGQHRYAYNGVSYKLETVPANWPSTIGISQYGHLMGTTTDPVGTVYSGIVLSIRDGDGFVGRSEPFDITVLAAANLAPLTGSLDKTLEWTESEPFSIALPALANAFGTLTYSFDQSSSEVAITNAAKGEVSGNIGTAGTYTFPYSVEDGTDRSPATGVLTLKINAPLQATAQGKYAANRAGTFSHAVPASAGGTAPFTYDLTGTLPAGVSYSNGILFGTPTQEGTFPLSVTVTDKTGVERSVSFDLEVGAPLPFDISFGNPAFYYGQFGLAAPSISNALGGNQAVRWGAASGTLPRGIRFDTEGAFTGRFVGTPEETGRFPGIVVSASDGEGRGASATVDLTVSRSGMVEFSDVAFTHRKEVFFTDTLTASNVVEPVTFSSSDPSGVPYGLVLNGTSGAISGMFSEVGSYPLSLAVADDMGRTDSATVTFEIIGDLAVSVSDVVLKQYTAPASPMPATVTNAIGTPTFSLASGTLPQELSVEASTGAIVGAADEHGVFSDLVIEVRDVDGATASSAAFSVTVEPRDALALQAPATLSLKQFSMASFTSEVTYAIPPVEFSVSPALPEGLTLDQGTGAITGSTDAIVPETVYTLTSVDAKGGTLGTSTAQFTLAVSERDALDVAGPDVYAFTQFSNGSVEYDPVNAIGDVVFTISPELPVGIELDPFTGTISSASEIVVPAAQYVLTAVDSKGGELGTKSKTITLEVKDRPQLDIAYAAVTGKRYQPITPVSPVVAADTAIGAVTYSIAPELPAGLTMDPQTGVISGTPDVAVSDITYTVTAADAKGGVLGTDTVPVVLSIAERDPLEISLGDVAGKRYESIAPLTIAPTAGTAIGEVSYSVSPALPVGLNLVDGVISGTPEEPLAAATFTVTAVDSKGGALGTDEAQFTITIADRDALGIAGADLYEFDQFFNGSIAFTPVNGIGTATFSISPALPGGLTLDQTTGVISGAANELLAATQFVLTVVDDHDSFDKTITLSVGDRLPMEIVTAAEQPLMLGYAYTLTLGTKNVVGENITWEHVSGDLPAGLGFDENTGTFSGTPAEFGTVSNVTVSAHDGFGGIANRTFVFTVIQDGTPIGLTAQGATTRVGEAFAIPTPVASNIVGDPVWSLDAGSTGLVIDSKTGIISGTPYAAFSADVVVKVTDATGREASAIILVVAEPRIVVTVPSEIRMTFNRDVPAEAKAVAANTVGQVTWSISGVLPQGITVDAATGAFVGKPMQIGTFGPVYLTAADSLPGTTRSQAATVTVVMNSDPIDLAVADYVTKVNYPVATAAPSYGNNLGPVTFSSVDLAGTGLSIDPATGILTGTAQDLDDRFINIAVRDRDTIRTTSRPMRYQVIPDMQVTMPAQVTLSALTDITPVAPSREYVIGEAVWNELDQTVNALPEGIVFDTTTGTLRGKAKEIGTFGPFTVSSTDSLGDTGTSNSFTIKVNPGSHFIGLAEAELPDATKRVVEYSYDFKQNLTYVGMDESEIAWSLGAGSPPGLTLSNGVLSGTPTLSGTYSFEVTASNQSLASTRSYTLEVRLPETVLELVASPLPDARRAVTGQDTAYSFDFNTLLSLSNIPAADVTYQVETLAEGESLPAGIALASNGVMSGTTSAVEKDYSFRVTARYVNGSDEDVSVTTAYSLKVIESIRFAFGTQGLADATKRLPYEFDLHTLIDDASLAGVTKSDLVWTWSVDPNRDAATTMSELPAGLTISGRTISGTPANSGQYALVLSASYDGRTVSRAFVLNIGLQEIALSLADGTLPDGDWNVAYAADLSTGLTTQNIPASAVKWSASSDVVLEQDENAGVPAGLVLDAGSGVISGTPSGKGKYRFAATAIWDDTNAAAEHAEDTKVYTITINGIIYKFKEISVGFIHSCGITPSDGVMCWGNNAFGQIGDGTTTESVLPVDVPGLTSGVASVAVGVSYSCALTTSGGVKCWGRNDVGQLGNGTTTNSYAPLDVTGLTSGVASLASGGAHMCAITTSSGLKCWGAASSGQIGHGSAPSRVTPPVDVSGLTSGVASVSLGTNHTCAVTTSGGLKCWGGNANGQLGNNSTIGTSSPVNVTGLTSGVKSVSSGTAYTCAVLTSGAARCWGLNGASQLGDGTTTQRQVPVAVSGLTSGVGAIAAGYDHTCALMSAGGVKCWGTNQRGQLGTGSAGGPAAATPVNATAFPTTGIAALHVSRFNNWGGGLFRYNTCVVTATNQARCVGDNGYGQLGDGSKINKVAPVLVGG